MTGSPQDANWSICRRLADKGTSSPPAPSITSGLAPQGSGIRSGFDFDAFARGGDMRRGWQLEAIGFRQNPLGSQPGQAPHRVAIGFAVEPGLDRLPIIAAQCASQGRAEHGLADPGVRAGDDEACAHGSSRSSSNRSASIISLDKLLARMQSERDAQARRPFGHRRRPDRADVVAVAAHGGRQGCRAPV